MPNKYETIRIPGFKGGISNSGFSQDLNKFQKGEDWDMFSSDNILSPNLKLTNDTGVDDTNKISSVIQTGGTANSGNSVYALGNDGSDHRRLFVASILWGNPTTFATASGSPTSSTGLSAPDLNGFFKIVEYKNYLYYLDKSSAISRYGDITGSPSYTQNWQSGLSPTFSDDVIFNHKGLGNLYFGRSNVVDKFDNTTFTSAALTLDGFWRIKSMCEYGQFVVIGADHVNGGANSKLFIWDGTASTVEDIIDLGDLGIQAIRNVNGVVHVLCIAPNSSLQSRYLRIYTWAGGQVQFSYELNLNFTAVNRAVVIKDSAVTVQKNVLYWIFNESYVSGSSVMGIDNGVYAYGSGPGGDKFLTLDRLTSNNTTSKVNGTCLVWIFNNLNLLWNNNTHWKYDHNLGTAQTVLSSDCVYQSQFFKPPTKYKWRIIGIKIYHKPLPSGVNFDVKLLQYGTNPYGTSSPTPESFSDSSALLLPFGGNHTQATTNSTFTYIPNTIARYHICDFAQIQITTTSNNTNSVSLIFPIEIEAKISESE